MSTAVTKDRMQKLRDQLVAAAATDPELAALADEIHAEELAAAAVTPASGGNLLQLAIAPETLLKLTSSGTKELVITIRDN